MLLLPVFIAIFYLVNFDFMNSEDEDVVEEFDSKYGAPMEGLKRNQRWSIAYPVTFITRRILYVLIILFLFKNVILQLIFQLVLSLLAFAYLVHFKPFEDPLIQKLEVFNEIICVVLIETLFCFTDIITDE